MPPNPATSNWTGTLVKIRLMNVFVQAKHVFCVPFSTTQTHNESTVLNTHKHSHHAATEAAVH